MNVNQLAAALMTFPLDMEVRVANDGSEGEPVTSVTIQVADDDQFVLVSR